MLPNINDYAGILDELRALWPYLSEGERDDIAVHVEVDAVLDAIERADRRQFAEQVEMVLERVIGDDDGSDNAQDTDDWPDVGDWAF